MDRSFLSLRKAIQNQAGALKLQYMVSFHEAGMKNIIDDMVPSRYLPKQSCLSYVRYVSFHRLLKTFSMFLAVGVTGCVSGGP